MPAFLAPVAGKVVTGTLLLVAILLAVWWFKRSIERRKDAEAKAIDLRLRAEAEQASHGGYAGEKHRLEQVDPLSGRPLDELRGSPGPGPAEGDRPRHP